MMTARPTLSATRATARLALAASLAALGCGIVAPEDAPQERLAEARARWRATGLHDYEFTLRRSCFCLPESLGPVRMTVFSSVFVSQVVYVDTLEPMPEEFARWFPSVEGLFDLLEDAMNRGAARVEVTYDLETGIPLDLFIDYDEQVADEEIGFSAGSPVPIE